MEFRKAGVSMSLSDLVFTLLNYLDNNPEKGQRIVKSVEVTDRDNIRIHYKKEGGTDEKK